ncbi:AAA family ATPase [Lactobacillus gasseri]|uniref:AAA family ATPase n=1 Tax=Lactobacillus gasseri TaxID=1596 RepID=UPI000660E5D2|nr:AAA family ATPase [Lactobacillus gasseri]
MVKGIIYLAKAGTGKTTFITSGLKEQFKNKNVLFITYTRQNTENLKDKLQISSISFKDYEVLTFYQFLERELIAPYKLSIRENLELNYDISGLYFRNSKEINNSKYIKKKSSAFWQSESGALFGDKLSALLIEKRNQLVFENAVKRLEKFYDYIVIDEFQDIVKPELKILQKLGAQIYRTSSLKLILVGDLYQSCVEKTSLKISPYDKFTSNMSEERFVRDKLGLKTRYFDIDNRKLKSSYRVPPKVCEFVKSVLGIDIQSKNTNILGEVKYIDDSKLVYLINSEDCKLLTYDKRQKDKIRDKFNADESKMINYGFSKGMEYTNVIIFLTSTLTNALKRNDLSSMSVVIKNKFYVALTRTKGNVYLVPYNFIK